MIDLERRLASGKEVFSTTINGRTVRATTYGGVAGATRIFDIIRATGGYGTTPGARVDIRFKRNP
jgi:hypothetical protein